MNNFGFNKGVFHWAIILNEHFSTGFSLWTCSSITTNIHLIQSSALEKDCSNPYLKHGVHLSVCVLS